MKGIEHRLLVWLAESLQSVGLDVISREDNSVGYLTLKIKEKGIALTLRVWAIAGSGQDMNVRYQEYLSEKLTRDVDFYDMLKWLASYLSLKDGLEANAAGPFLYIESVGSRYNPIYFLLIDRVELTMSY